ncbi:protein translocase subunit SecF [Saccharibacillus alkalitolerans]|uniref:Protein-export membrane protein SecF n=1 Tax=Saccharibacillus alkalitolerans TaxID=2705290 RepID=A0ABX0EY54_9BACL|nr:protein translocase subunit SecF [Saccharibacillus alkalitolerans]NGZ73688.1 protein translocase subunit SecF [Saccharibacillus alkalitolerans]
MSSKPQAASSKWNFNFVKASKYFYTFSIVLTLAGILSLAVFGLNYGVDFRSGSNVDVSVSKAATQAQVQKVLADAKLDPEANITAGTDRVSIRFPEVLTDDEVETLQTTFNSQIDPNASYEINTVDVEMAKELERNALLAIAVASIGIVIYVTIRFEWGFALSAVVALLHDAFLVISVFSILRLEVNLTFIVAILTIIGFSINDTIVIFDRIRENLRFAKKQTPHDLEDVVNKSVSQTMTRSLGTVFTVFIAAFALLVLGSESIRMFSLAMVIGLLFGAYSSIFIASPLWLALRSKKKPSAAKPSKATT